MKGNYRRKLINRANLRTAIKRVELKRELRRMSPAELEALLRVLREDLGVDALQAA